MLKKIEKYNSPLVLSLIFHLILALIIVFSLARPVKQEVNISVSIVSSPDISGLYASKKKISHDHKKDEKHEIPTLKSSSDNSNNTKNEDEKDKESSKKQVINDLSYSKEIYKIGSKQNPTPSYPRMAKLRNYQGIVEVCAISDSKGNVVDVELHSSSGYSILDNSALKTLKKWKFDMKKASKDEINDHQLYRIIIPISFVIK